MSAPLDVVGQSVGRSDAIGHVTGRHPATRRTGPSRACST